MTVTPPEPGWYLDPYGKGCYRFFDGKDWTAGTSPVRGYVPPAPRRPDSGIPDPLPTTPVVEGPNHALHFILTLLTFWFFGGWVWVWLVIALRNKKTVRYL